MRRKKAEFAAVLQDRGQQRVHILNWNREN